MRNFLNKIKKNIVNIPGFRTQKKILVIESDDWGSIRMRSEDSNERLKSSGIDIDKNNFWKFDTLESKEDLHHLFNVLKSFKDQKGNYAKITPVSVVANPDFKAIKDSNFTQYSYMNLYKSYADLCKDDSILEYWKSEGINSGIFVPQFHGREHLNPLRWFEVLKSGNKNELSAFSEGVLLGEKHPFLLGSKSYMAAFEWHNEIQKQFVLNMIKDGTDLFERTFGFRSVSFASSQAIQNLESNQFLLESGIKFHQLGQFYVPQKNGDIKVSNKTWGSKNSVGQIYWRRNARFEPSKLDNTNWVANCLSEIETAFKWGKPAVISSHRVNYVGGISNNNRNNNLELLHDLIEKVVRKWPEVEFYNSIELSELIDK